MPTPALSPTPLETRVGSEWLNILLIGLDSSEYLKAQHTDVIIVVGVNRQTRQVSLLSIPRDLWVYIPTYGWDRINIAHPIGYIHRYPKEGPGLLADTIERNLGIHIDRWARVDFQGFIRVVDTLGGVDMVVPCRVNLEYRPSDSGGEGQILEPGIYHMDGATALRYVRTRRDGSDFDRARRQQQFLKAMWSQTKSISLGQIPDLFSALTGSVTADLNLLDVLSLAPVALSLEPQRIRSRFIGRAQTTDWTTEKGGQVLLPKNEEIQKLLQGLYAPLAAGEDLVAQEGARVQVRNGTTRAYLGPVAADQLRWYGMNVVDAASADRTDYARTQILIFNEKPVAVDLLQEVLKVRDQDVLWQPDPNQSADIQVILGADYNPCK